jgi:lipoyl synthase
MEVQRLPKWAKRKTPAPSVLSHIHDLINSSSLSTVCKEARCPNRGECFARGTATFLILGDRCTRNCSFCAVRHGTPLPPQPGEPEEVADAVAALGLKHAVITSVTRDDLPDGGAAAFAATVNAIRRKAPGSSVEVLIPDFQGSKEALTEVIRAEPDVINHNIETVPRLYPVLRRGASYRRSLKILELVRDLAPQVITKSGIMLGVGETGDEVLEVMHDLVSRGCLVLTLGQYLQPGKKHHPVARFVPPLEFEELRELALAAGMATVASGPLVRSSYKAGEILQEIRASRLPQSDHGTGPT